MPASRTERIHQFIIDEIPEHPSDIAARVCEQFGISRQAASRHLRRLVESGVLVSEGKTSARRYALAILDNLRVNLPIGPQSQEDIPWREEFRPRLERLPRNVLEICQYAFTEMLNNVIDHSESPVVEMECVLTAESVTFRMRDHGVGIFRKLRRDCGLFDEREAMLELAKGKLTTDPERHTGEGVFFTSRMVDVFSIHSGDLILSHTRAADDWRMEHTAIRVEGTQIRMSVRLDSSLDLQDFFERFASSKDDYVFSRTHVPVKLAQFGADNLISRSQARRVVARIEQFREVVLDFAGVDLIGQGFADEIFRVFQRRHPQIRLHWINATPLVAGLIRRALPRDKVQD